MAPWELRVGDLRVYYDVDVDNQKVIIVAVGRKDGNRVLFGGKEVTL